MDPWKHRSAGMTCKTCMWYVQKVAIAQDGPNEGQEIEQANSAPIGRCRRHAPTMSGYPVVFGTDWCGDHKLDENAV